MAFAECVVGSGYSDCPISPTRIPAPVHRPSEIPIQIEPEPAAQPRRVKRDEDLSACTASFERMNEVCPTLGLTPITKPMCAAAWDDCIHKCKPDYCTKGEVLLNAISFTKPSESSGSLNVQQNTQTNRQDASGIPLNVQVPENNQINAALIRPSPQKPSEKSFSGYGHPSQGMDGKANHGSQSSNLGKKPAKLGLNNENEDLSVSENSPKKMGYFKEDNSKLVHVQINMKDPLTGDYYSGNSGYNHTAKSLVDDLPRGTYGSSPIGHLGKSLDYPDGITGLTTDIFQKISLRYSDLAPTLLP